MAKKKSKPKPRSKKGKKDSPSMLKVLSPFLWVIVGICVTLLVIQFMNMTREPKDDPKIPVIVDPDISPDTAIAELTNCLPVYYYDDNTQYFIPLHLPLGSDDQPLSVKARNILNKLIAGPPVQGLKNIFPAGTKLNSVRIDGDLAIVDLSAEVMSTGGGSAWESGIVQSILLSMTELPGIGKVQILIDGKKVEYLPQGTVIDAPLSREGGPNSSEYIPEGKSAGYLYYLEKSGRFIVPIYWTWEGKNDDPVAKLETLYSSPQPPLNHSLISPAPKGIRIEKCVIEDNKLAMIIDHHEFASAFDENSAEKFLTATIQTLYEIKPFTKMDIRVGGKEKNREIWSYSAFANLQDMRIPPSCYNKLDANMIPRI